MYLKKVGWRLNHAPREESKKPWWEREIKRSVNMLDHDRCNVSSSTRFLPFTPVFLLNTAVNPQCTICNSVAVPHQQPPNKKTTITPGCRHFRGASYVSNQGKLYLRTATMPPVDMKTRRESSRPSASKVVTKLTHSHLKIGILPSKGKACIPTIHFQVRTCC